MTDPFDVVTSRYERRLATLRGSESGFAAPLRKGAVMWFPPMWISLSAGMTHLPRVAARS